MARHRLHRHLAEEPDPIPFYLVTAPMSFAKDHAELIAAIKVQLGAEKPVAIVLDTLNRSLGGSESDDKDMGAWLKVQATEDGSFSVTNSRTGWTKTYDHR